MRSMLGGLVIAAAIATVVMPAGAAWDPEAYRDQSTLDFLTVEPEGEHWSPVWLVVIDGQVYLRLGSRAAGRIEGNSTKPIIKVKVAGEQFDRVRGEPAPEMADRVAAAMADKYTTDIFVRYFAHPLTLRLVPEAP